MGTMGRSVYRDGKSMGTDSCKLRAEFQFLGQALQTVGLEIHAGVDGASRGQQLLKHITIIRIRGMSFDFVIGLTLCRAFPMLSFSVESELAAFVSRHGFAVRVRATNRAAAPLNLRLDAGFPTDRSSAPLRLLSPGIGSKRRVDTPRPISHTTAMRRRSRQT